MLSMLANPRSSVNQHFMAELTQILRNWSNEDRQSKDRVIAALYDELHRLARTRLAGRGVVDLQPTELVHEAYFKLIDLQRMDMKDRAHLLGVAGRVMREVLVDEARRARAHKRDRALETRLTGDVEGGDLALVDLLELHDALGELEREGPEYLWLVDARVFAGLTIDEAAAGLGVSRATVKRKWQVVRAWIATRSRAAGGPAGGGS